MKSILAISLIVLCFNSFASDLTADFYKIYDKKADFTKSEKEILKDFDFYFIPGILAETFIWSDKRSYVDLSLVTRDYFSTQVKFLQDKYKFSSHRLTTSSKDVEETRQNIRTVIEDSIKAQRKPIFISHSLGGLALLEELVFNSRYQSAVGGIIFLQSPFYGSPLADLTMEAPYQLEKYIKPLLPYLNISEATMDYLRPVSRIKFMETHKNGVKKLIEKIPVITVSGKANGSASIFKPLLEIMDEGCIKKIAFPGCLTGTIYKGPFDKSDGMVPLKSSQLETANSIILDEVDHGEMVLNIPFENYSKEHTTTTLLRLILPKLNPKI